MNDEDVLNMIKRVSPANFQWKELDEDDNEIGFEAEEIDYESYKIYEEKIHSEKRFNYEEMLLNLLKYLDQTGNVDFAILKDPELGRYWAKKKKEIELHRKKIEALEKLNNALTKEELKILGIRIK